MSDYICDLWEKYFNWCKEKFDLRPSATLTEFNDIYNFIKEEHNAPIRLQQQGARWFLTANSPNNSKASMGLFFSTVIMAGGHIGTVWCMSHIYPRASVHVTVYMTDKMRHEIESKTKFRFVDPPRIHLNNS